jgi:hypothetical protein
MPLDVVHAVLAASDVPTRDGLITAHLRRRPLRPVVQDGADAMGSIFPSAAEPA